MSSLPKVRLSVELRYFPFTPFSIFGQRKVIGQFAQLWRRNDRVAVCGRLVTVSLLFVFDLRLVQSSTEVSWVPGGMPCS
jgi:hypothetical protein